MTLTSEEHRIVDEIEKDHPGVPRYFCEMIYRYVTQNPEQAEYIMKNNLDLPRLRRDEGMSDEEKLKARDIYNQELKKVLGDYIKTS